MATGSEVKEAAMSVSISDSDIQAATSLLAKLVGLEPAAVESAVARLRNAHGQRNRAENVQRAQRIREHRARRGKLFPQPIFGEPPWEMLMALYVDHREEGATTAELAANTNLPSTTAARWLGYLEDHGLVSRRLHPNDRRCSLVELTDSAMKALDECFASGDVF